MNEGLKIWGLEGIRRISYDVALSFGDFDDFHEATYRLLRGLSLDNDQTSKENKAFTRRSELFIFFLHYLVYKEASIPVIL